MILLKLMFVGESKCVGEVEKVAEDRDLELLGDDDGSFLTTETMLRRIYIPRLSILSFTQALISEGYCAAPKQLARP